MLWLICVLTLPFERKIKIKEKNPKLIKGFFLVEIQIITQSYIVYFSIISIIILSIHLCEFIHLFISKTKFQQMLKDFILILSYKRSSCVSWFGVKCKISVIINSIFGNYFQNLQHHGHFAFNNFTFQSNNFYTVLIKTRCTFLAHDKFLMYFFSHRLKSWNNLLKMTHNHQHFVLFFFSTIVYVISILQSVW